MPRGQQSLKNALYVSLKGLKKEDKSTYFDFVKKVNDEYVSDGHEQDFSGTLTNISIISKDFEDVKDVKYLRLVVEDGVESYIFDTKLFSGIGRNLMNSIPSIENFGHIMFKCYKNKRSYGQIYIESNGERVNWKFGMDELPEVRRVVVNGDTINDYNDINQFLLPHLNEAIERIKEQAPKPEPVLTGSSGIGEDAKEAATKAVLDMHKSDEEDPFGGDKVLADDIDDLPF